MDSKEAFDKIERKFTISNSIEVERSIILRADWELAKQYMIEQASRRALDGCGPVEWTAEMPANESIRYNHVTADTPFGRFEITWKGWNEHDSPTVDETPWGHYFGAFSTVDEAKAACELEYSRRICTACPASRQALEGEAMAYAVYWGQGEVELYESPLPAFGYEPEAVTPLYKHPASANAEFDIQKECWRHEAEDLQALHRNLDDAEVPQHENGTELSAWGRVLRMNQNSASADAAEVWEKAMMAAIGEDGIKSVADAIVRLKAGSVPEETLTAIHDTLRLVWSRELSADDGMDEIEILIPPTKADEWIKCSERLPSEADHYLVALSDPEDVGWVTDKAWTAFYNKCGECPEIAVEIVEDGQPVTHWMPLPAPPQEQGQ